MNILIIESNEEIVNPLKYGLKEVRCEVHYAADGEAGQKLALEKKFDIIVLDWSLPKKSGLSVLRELREKENLTPIMMLTPEDSVGDIVVSLDSGADTCATKPFEIRELIARMNALVRRKKWNRDAEICYANLRLDPVNHKVWSNDNKIELTGREYSLLLYLMRNPEQVVTRAMISKNVWGNTLDRFTNIVEVYVNYLRKKLDCEVDKKLIHTVRGTGYIFKSV